MTYHNDNNRDGVNSQETFFTSTYFQTHTPTPVTYPTDGLIYAQPLYIKGLNGSNQKVGVCPSPANVVFAATENNTVYALEAPPFTPPVTNTCWQLNLNQSGETAIPYTDLPASCDNLLPQVGITGTPVIDASVTPPILYVVTSHKAGTTHTERLHAIDTTTGLEIATAVDIGGALGNNFSIVNQNQRPALALFKSANNIAKVYIGWSSNCDFGNYQGWVAGFQLNYSSLQFTHIGTFTSEPPTGTGNQGGIWMAGSGPAVDSNGNVYVAVGNGTLTPPSQTSGTWGDSVLKLTPSLTTVADFYTPNDYLQLDNGSGQTGICFGSATSPNCPPGVTHKLVVDTDMGTGGVVLLSPTQLISVGKQGMVYLIPHDTSTSSSTTMGGLDGCGYSNSCTVGSDPTTKACSTSGPGSITQCFEAMAFDPTVGSLNGIWGAPAFWSTGGYLFGIGLHDRMYWYGYSAPTFNTASPPQSDHQFNKQNGPVGVSVGGTVSVTWDGHTTNTGVAWTLDSNGYGRSNPHNTPPFQGSTQAVIYVYPATPSNLTCGGGGYVCELWDSNLLTNHSTVMPGAVKFSVPTVVDGYIVIGGGVPNYFAPGSACDAINFPSCAGQLTILH